MKKPKRVDGSSCFGQCWVAVGLVSSISRGYDCYDSPTIGWSKPVICETKNQLTMKVKQSPLESSRNGQQKPFITNLFEATKVEAGLWVSSRVQPCPGSPPHQFRK
jgi:hypothetical protein